MSSQSVIALRSGLPRRWLLAGALGSSLLAAALPLRAGEAGDRSAGEAKAGPAVRITVIKVRATAGERPPGGPVIGPSLEKLPLARLPYSYARYDHEGTTEHDVAWGEKVKIPLGEGGSYDVWPDRASKPGHVVLNMRETRPREEKPCAEFLGVEVPSGKSQLWFCDGVLPDGTYLVFVTAKPLEGD